MVRDPPTQSSWCPTHSPISTESWFSSSRRRIAYRASMNTTSSPAAAGLMSYGLDLDESFDLLGSLVDSILKGAKHADLPFQQPTRFRSYSTSRPPSRSALKPRHHYSLAPTRSSSETRTQPMTLCQRHAPLFQGPLARLVIEARGGPTEQQRRHLTLGKRPLDLSPALFPDDCIQLQPRLRAHCHVCRAPHIGAVYREASHSSDAAATCAYQRTPAEIRSRSTPTRYEAVCDPGLHRRSSQYDDNDRDHDHSDRYAHTRAQAEIV